MNICFIADNNLAPYLTVTLESIKKNCKGFIDIYIYYIQLDDTYKVQLKLIFSETDIALHFIKIEKEMLSRLEKLYEQATNKLLYPLECQAKIALAWLLPKEIDRCIYLDIDTLVLNDLAELYSCDLEGKSLGACIDITMLKLLQIDSRAIDGLSEKLKEMYYYLKKHYQDESYFNSGVMLLNVGAIRGKYSYEMMEQALDKIDGYLPCADQDLYNAMFCNDIKYLPSEKYNFQVASKSYDYYQVCDPFFSAQNAIVIHYLDKPWRIWQNSQNLVKNVHYIWFEYAKRSVYFDGWQRQMEKALICSKQKELFLVERELKNMSDNTLKCIMHKFFKQHNFKKIGVYGAGIFGKLFIQDMPEGFEYCFFDKSERSIMDYTVLDVTEIESCENLNILIITPFYYEEIIDEMRKNLDIPIIGYDELVRMSW